MVVSRKTGYIYHDSYPYSYQNYPAYNWNEREDIVAFSTTGNWSSGNSTQEVTGTSSGLSLIHI